MLLNPRREQFDMKDKSASAAQIRWEHRHLHAATAIVFWFCAETLCPVPPRHLSLSSRCLQWLTVCCAL